MYYTQQATSETRDTLVSDPSNSQPFHSRSSGPLPPISSISLPPARNNHLSDYRLAYDAPYTSNAPGHLPYTSTHTAAELDHHSSFGQPQYGYAVDALSFSDRDHRFMSLQESYYRSQTSRAPEPVLVDDFSQLDPALMLSQHDQHANLLPRDHSIIESSSSQSPEADSGVPTSRTKKSRREKPRIELAPDQPLTTQGKPRARVYVACLQCRTRKIRCDGAKPTCHNCSRRAKANEECTYDAAPKRRGPDKTPGARQRMAREARLESEADVVASRRRRRRKHEVTTVSPASGLGGGDDGPRSVSGPALHSLSQSPLALDPQLPNIQPYPDEPVATSIPLHNNSFDGGSGSGSVMSRPLSEPDALYQMTNRQGLDNVFSFSSGLAIQPAFHISESSTHSFISPLNDDDSENSDTVADIISEPSLDFARKTWWDSLLTMYTSSSHLSALSLSQRQSAANLITNDLRFLFRTSNYWFSFINVPHFLSIYFNPQKRDRMQPSFIPAALAIATLLQSSEAGFGREGRERALRLRDIAQGALEASFNARWIDEQLAQAAWLLAFFEVCTHPNHTRERSSSAILMLDTIIRTLSLTLLDIDNPTVTGFSAGGGALVPQSKSLWRNTILSSSSDTSSNISNYRTQGCSCVAMSLGQRWLTSRQHTPLWISTPGWDDSWSESDIRREICRRLCWSSLTLVAGHTSYLSSTTLVYPRLFLLEPANYALLFPGEALNQSLRSSDYAGKDTVWSLTYRTMFLWHSCLRMRHDRNATDAERARFGVDAWLEADALEEALNAHTCGLERTYLFQGREYLFNVRLTVSHEFQRYIPIATISATSLFHRKKAEEWLIHQANVAQRVVDGMGAVTGHAANTLLHRPFFAFWFMSQITRALSLWQYDNSLTLALDVCLVFFKPIDYLSVLWPCEAQTHSAEVLRQQLAQACKIAGRRPPPPSPEITL
ncbi:hypothetical protein F5I97DRAFT_1884201 [Phlebopus sp. FC_14]|nr:hypothetical protein F5I97DRAFT_1884201 [Phlebopus sp. FC_14]